MHVKFSRSAALIFYICAVLLGASSARADVTRFDLAGVVTDATGSVLPGVTVTVKNLDTGFTRSVVTDAEGRYAFTALPPTGRWSITAELQGFQTLVREGLVFQANTRPVLDLRLGVGGVQEAVEVSGSSPLVRTRESELSAILDAQQVEKLPTNGRNFLSLLQTSGSVVPTGGGSGAISVNGQGIRMANFVADGVSMTGREIRTLNGEFGGGNGLSLDVIKELQVISNGFKAETGQTGAGTISVITKSGTNALDGSVYGFWLPSAWVARNLLTGAETTQKRYQYRRHRWRAHQERSHALLRQLRVHRHRRRGRRHVGSGAGHLPSAAAAAAGLLQSRPPLQRPQPVRRQVQLQP